MPRFARVSVLFALLLSVGVLAPGRAQEATPAATAPGHLVVADYAASVLYIYSLPDLQLTAELTGISVLEHSGFLMLPDGRLLFVDRVSNELVALQVDAPDGPEIVGRIAVPGSVSHIAADPAASYAIVGSSDPNAPLTLVDLSSFTSRTITVTAGEAGVMLGGDPLALFHRNDVLQQVESYPLDLLQTGSTTPTGIVDTGAFGHGEAIDHERGRIYVATDDGLDVVDIVEDGLAYHATLPWDASGRTGGRAYFVRVGADGDHLYSYMADRAAEESAWDTWSNDAYIADLETETIARVELGPGLVYRFALSDTIGLFFNIHPDGDNAILLDTDPTSPTFATVIARIPLDPLTGAAAVGESPWEAESRIAAITPDGSLGFISHGGDGVISVIDTASQSISATIAVPTSLSGGGYMIAIGPEMSFADTVAR